MNPPPGLRWGGGTWGPLGVVPAPSSCLQPLPHCTRGYSASQSATSATPQMNKSTCSLQFSSSTNPLPIQWYPRSRCSIVSRPWSVPAIHLSIPILGYNFRSLARPPPPYRWIVFSMGNDPSLVHLVVSPNYLKICCLFRKFYELSQGIRMTQNHGFRSY